MTKSEHPDTRTPDLIAELVAALEEVVGTTLQAFPALAHQPAFIRATAALAKAKEQNHG